MQTPIGVPALIVLATIQRLKNRASGLAIIRETGFSEGSVYNITSRLVRASLIGSKRAHTTLYALTNDGDTLLKDVRKAISP
jgi:DNA-binding PadR family transcriptional regulator